jgi:hypothetical protein
MYVVMHCRVPGMFPTLVEKGTRIDAPLTAIQRRAKVPMIQRWLWNIARTRRKKRDVVVRQVKTLRMEVANNMRSQWERGATIRRLGSSRHMHVGLVDLLRETVPAVIKD